ncbi:PREDICTED: cadherin-related family member 4 isoform X2 [Calidris pugnax]|uniref:cadherin-related family member 4 isoform X2 n=1 Tax=Calidris pugnax TaxID=198806 RepID=UPI00071D9DC9|nr:PREDICTED: cadherin-related family member 4 isoform X2 [Calidris pugnax]
MAARTGTRGTARGWWQRQRAMGMHGRLTFLLLLLLGLCAPGTFVRATALHDLPLVVALSEEAAPGTRVAEVTVSCSNASGSPNVTLHGVEPGHPFNPIAISADPTATTRFRAEVTLRAGAELDAHRVNQYTLTLRAACPGEEEVEERLFVRVTAGQVLRCDAPFASTGGDVVRVSADVAPRTPLYVVLPQPLGGLTFRLRNPDTPLTLTHRGLVLAPAGGFDPSKDTQTFRLEIEVTDRHGHNCSGAVTVEVLPSRRPTVTFLELQREVTVPEGTRPLEVVTQVRASGDNVRYAILAPVAPVLFTINEMTGEIRSTGRLKVAHTRLFVRAYNALRPADSDTATLNITVQGTDRWALSCAPAISVSQVPETVSPGETLVTLRCTDPTGTEDCLRYALEGSPTSLSHFHMEGPRLQVNTTLDYDSEAMAAVGFQFTATIVVTAGGQPPRSTRVPVLVMVTPVNEFTPTCPSSADFTVLETAAFGSAVGRVVGTDRDYPPNSLEYSLEGGTGPTQPFSIDTRTGEIWVVGPLDYQRHKSYRLTVRLTDTRNDLDPTNRRSRLCNVLVRLQAVLNQAPVCTPEVQELQITAGLGGRQPVTRLACQDSPGGAALTYAIAGGNEDGRFRLEGNTLFYLPDDLAEPRTFMLLVEVWGSPSVPRRSTVVPLVVHITPRTTPVPPSSTTTRHTTLQKEPLVITRTEEMWHPPAWFVAVLTVTSALLLATLGCTARSLLCRHRAPGKLLVDQSSWDVVEQKGGKEERGHPDTSSPGQFDGRAQDPRTGRDYLFNSVTGARRWI